MARIENKVLILYAHPSPRRSEVNVHMARVAEWVPGVTLVDLYAEYPTFDIDVDAEQSRLNDHDVLIFQFPFYWYSTPAILKEWQDLVLEYDYAYGKRGTALHGKTFLCALTAGAPEDAYHTEGYNNFGVRELIAPLEQSAALCGMTFLPPLVLFGARSARERHMVEPHLDQWEHLLEALVHGRLDISAAQQAPLLNPYVNRLLAEV
ncbi:MAG: NAD(P)H-dependent oxidoreductase [Pseudomonadota bacterium]